MRKCLKILMYLFLLSMCMRVSFVSAAESKVSVENTDSGMMKVYPKYEYTNVDSLRAEGKTYLFTKKSAARIIPIQINADGVMVYCFSSEKVKLLDNKRKTIIGRMDEEVLGVDYSRYEEFVDEQGREGTRHYSIPRRLISVKENETYYLQIPAEVPEEGYEVYAYLHPKEVKKLENGKVFMSEGTGKYIYYPFRLKKKSLAGLYIDGVFSSYEGGDTMYFRVQKKVGGKWKNITSVRSKLASLGQCGRTAPYGLSKGNYRFGIKVKKGQIAYIDVDIRNIKHKNSTKKSKALMIKKGKNKKGVFTWEDTKAHWYKVVKSNKNKVKKLTVYAGGAADKFQFTIFKEGVLKPLKKIKIRGKNRTFHFLEYTSKSFSLKDNGTYYIKVSKANKKTNGAYKISVK